jgi:hypothetical protein
MTLKLIINVTHHSGESTVTQNLTAPLDPDQPDLQPPESKRFATPDEALAYAKQLQTEAGGLDMARIEVHDFRRK